MNNSDFHRLMNEFNHSAMLHPDFDGFFKREYPEVYARYYRPGFRDFITTHDASVILKKWQETHGFEFYQVKRIIRHGVLDLL